MIEENFKTIIKDISKEYEPDEKITRKLLNSILRFINGLTEKTKQFKEIDKSP